LGILVAAGAAPALTAVSGFSNRPVRMSGPLFENVGDGNASRHHQETGFGSRLRIYRSRRWEGVLLPPQRHRGQLRPAAGRREGFLRGRVEPQGASREDRPHRLSRDEPDKPLAERPGAFSFVGRGFVYKATSADPLEAGFVYKTGV